MERIKEKKSWWLLIAYFVGMISIAVFVCGCKSTEYIEVEKVRDVYHHSVDTLRDSIYHNVFVNQYIKGDTVYNERTEYIYKDKWRMNTDTIIRTDSIPVPYVKEVEVEVPAQISWLQKTTMLIGVVTILIGTLILAGWIVKKYKN